MRIRSQSLRTTLLAVAVCALASCNSLQLPQSPLDPSGDHIFLPPARVPRAVPQGVPTPAVPYATSDPYAPPATPILGANRSGPKWKHDRAVTIAPRSITAPVGTEVVLTATVCGYEGYSMAAEQVEWMVGQGGVGEIVALGERETLFDKSKKITSHYAIGTTSRRDVILDRGTENPADDVTVLKGQSWVSIVSATEGVSHVTAYAPEVYSWNCRTDSTTIEWVDATWQFPPPAVNPAGTSHVFTTSVVRASNGQPLAGWIVRYEIADGPAAGFRPDGAQAAEAVTNEAGQASVELAQTEVAHGTNQIRIEIIRPANPATGAQRSIIARGATTKTWSAPQVGVRISGPSIASVGSTASYRIEAFNTGSVDTQGVTLSLAVPPGMTLVGSNPPAQGGAASWNIGPLAAGQSQGVQVDLRPERQGSMNVCVTARSIEGAQATNCLATTVGTDTAPPVTQPPVTQPPVTQPPATQPEQTGAALQVTIEGPQQARVGDELDFTMLVTNTGTAPATGLVIRNTYDAGLKHASARNPLQQELRDLPPGMSIRSGIHFTVDAAGRLCQSVEVLGNNNLRASARHCLDVPQPAPAHIDVRMTGPQRQNAGELALFEIEIRNTGTDVIRKLQVTHNYDADLLKPEDASDGFEDPKITRKLIWNLTDLPAGKALKLQVQCRCKQAAARACNSVSVVADGSAPVVAEACVQIVGEPKLSVLIDDLNENVQVEGIINYFVLVKNDGTAPASQVRVQIQLPPSVRFDSADARNPTRHDLTGNVLRFQPLDTLAAGEKLEYRFKVVARQAGASKLTASTSATGLQPVAAEVMTNIMP